MNDLFDGESIPVFEKIKLIDENGEYWLARQLSSLLEYIDYRSFRNVMLKAWQAAKNSTQDPRNHFVRVTQMVSIGSGAKKEIDDVRLTRYACYLIVQNGDPSKEVIALGQTYFAVQTRIQEIQQMQEYASLDDEGDRRIFLRKQLIEHNKLLSAAAKSAGVIDPLDYAIFKNYGYKGLYGGLDKKGIQNKKRLPSKNNMLDHMGSTELAANLFLATQTEEKLKKDKIKTKDKANITHYNVGKKIRNTIAEIGGTMPEDLPVAENIKSIENKSSKGISE